MCLPVCENLAVYDVHDIWMSSQGQRERYLTACLVQFSACFTANEYSKKSWHAVAALLPDLHSKHDKAKQTFRGKWHEDYHLYNSLSLWV